MAENRVAVIIGGSARRARAATKVSLVCCVGDQVSHHIQQRIYGTERNKLLLVMNGARRAVLIVLSRPGENSHVATVCLSLSLALPPLLPVIKQDARNINMVVPSDITFNKI